MSRGKRIMKSILKTIYVITIAIIISLLLTGLFIKWTSAISINKMNEMELWYDADGPLIMVDTDTQIIGIYNAATPIKHISYGYSDSGCSFGTLDIETELVIINIEESIYTYLKDDDLKWIKENVPDDTPVVVY